MEHTNFYRRIKKTRRIRWARHVAWGTKDIQVYRVLVGRPDGNSLLGRPRFRWEDNIKLDFQEMEWGGMDWLL
jgi:hypothetical protein